MTEIIDFLEKAKQFNDEPLPVEKEAVFRNLLSLSQDDALEYIKGIDIYVENVLLWKSIFSSKDNPRTLRNLIEDLDQNHLKRLNQIVLGLVAEDSIRSLKQVVDATLNGNYPTEECFDKALDLVNLISGLNINHIEKAKALAMNARQSQELADAFFMLDSKFRNEFNQYAFDKLSRCDESDLDNMISVVSRLKGQAVNH